MLCRKFLFLNTHVQAEVSKKEDFFVVEFSKIVHTRTSGGFKEKKFLLSSFLSYSTRRNKNFNKKSLCCPLFYDTRHVKAEVSKKENFL